MRGTGRAAKGCGIHGIWGGVKLIKLPGHWRGVRTLNNLWKSDLLPSTMVLLEQQHRSQDSVLRGFWKRTRAESASLLPLCQEAIQKFRAPGPYDVEIVIPHAKRRRLNEQKSQEQSRRDKERNQAMAQYAWQGMHMAAQPPSGYYAPQRK